MDGKQRDLARGLVKVLREDGSADPEQDPFLPPDQLLAIYGEMVRIRVIDERMLARQRQGKVGFFGTITGQEATPVATAFATRPTDWIFPALRESAIMLARGFPLDRWLCQVYGNEHDLLKGRQMPSHMSGKEVHQVTWSSCIGPQIPQAVGAAMAARIRGDETVTVAFMGDGATSEPNFHNALALASRGAAPCVLICQNNHWSISLPTAQQTASETLAVKAHAYGMPGVRVDGNDVLALYATIHEAVERARKGQGPTFIEAVTYRMGPHSSSDDPTRYRSDAEVKEWGERDPVARFARYLEHSDLVDAGRREQLRAETDAQVMAAIRRVEVLPPPELASLFEDVYADTPWHLDEQAREIGRC